MLDYIDNIDCTLGCLYLLVLLFHSFSDADFGLRYKLHCCFQVKEALLCHGDIYEIHTFYLIYWHTRAWYGQHHAWLPFSLAPEEARYSFIWLRQGCLWLDLNHWPLSWETRTPFRCPFQGYDVSKITLFSLRLPRVAALLALYTSFSFVGYVSLSFLIHCSDQLDCFLFLMWSVLYAQKLTHNVSLPLVHVKAGIGLVKLISKWSLANLRLWDWILPITSNLSRFLLML